VLEVHDVVVRYGRLKRCTAFHSKSSRGEIVTAARRQTAPESRRPCGMLSGLRAPVSGSVTFEGRDITQVKATSLPRWASATFPKVGASSP